MDRDKSYDVIIVGGGDDGLSAALVLGRARRSVAVIDARAPRNAPAAHMQGSVSRWHARLPSSWRVAAALRGGRFASSGKTRARDKARFE